MAAGRVGRSKQHKRESAELSADVGWLSEQLNQVRIWAEVTVARQNQHEARFEVKNACCTAEIWDWLQFSVLWSEMCSCVSQVIEDDKQWWKLRNRSGQAGYVPFNILDVVKLEDRESVFHQVTCCAIQCIFTHGQCGDVMTATVYLQKTF